jgi:hypothetical protein
VPGQQTITAGVGVNVVDAVAVEGHVPAVRRIAVLLPVRCGVVPRVAAFGGAGTAVTAHVQVRHYGPPRVEWNAATMPAEL